MSAQVLSPGEELHAELGQNLQKEAYKELRLNPKPGDELYICLIDLRKALDGYATNGALKILDYGCGCSPYRDLFPNCEYRRADYLDTGDLDFRIEPGKPLPEKDETYDLILSTQVLEHVNEPDLYLAECFRLLKPGGRLLLSTHGTFPDHGCPYDFRRWTADGLKYDLKKAGFTVEQGQKLTAGPRAVLMVLEHYAEDLVAPNFQPFGFIFGLLRKLIRSRRAAFHRWADRYFGRHSVTSSDCDTPFYVGVIFAARKNGADLASTAGDERP